MTVETARILNRAAFGVSKSAAPAIVKKCQSCMGNQSAECGDWERPLPIAQPGGGGGADSQRRRAPATPALADRFTPLHINHPPG